MLKWSRSLRASLAITVTAVALVGCEASTAEPETVNCDRACLMNGAESYIAAIAANDPAQAPLADEVSFVEDLQRLQTGEGLWQSASGGPTAFSVFVPDEVNHTAGWLGMLERDGEPVLVAVRLAFDGDRIVEAEHLTTEIRPENMGRVQTLRVGLLGEVPEGSRQSHDELIRIGQSYYDALDDNDGSLTPFAPDCERHENGMITAGESAGPGPNSAGQAPIARDCAGQLTSNVMAYIDTIDNRRVFAADPVTGLVMGLSHFRHAMNFEPYEVTALDGSTMSYGPDRFPFEAFDLPAAHIFKVGSDGMVHEIEAMGFQAPHQSATGWE